MYFGAAAFGGAFNHAANNDFIGAGAINWCGQQYNLLLALAALLVRGLMWQPYKTTAQVCANGHRASLSKISLISKILYRFTRPCNYAAYTQHIISQIYRFPAHLQTTKSITYNFHSDKGSCLNLLAIRSYIFIQHLYFLHFSTIHNLIFVLLVFISVSYLYCFFNTTKMKP